MTAEKLIRVAAKELGYTEAPKGSNRTKYGKWFGLDGQPWCMMFVQWCAKEAGCYDLLPVHTASCGQLMRAAKAEGLWVEKTYRPGDILIFDFPGGAETDHTGICESVTGTGVVSIEGNTGTGNDANGGQVQRRKRPNSVIRGAVRLKFKEDDFVDWSKVTAAEINQLPPSALEALVARVQTYLGGKPVTGALAAEWDKAKAERITDGTSPQAFCTRAQTAAMIQRAKK